jgi:hypothetical protein
VAPRGFYRAHEEDHRHKVLRETAAVLVLAVSTAACGAKTPPPTDRQWVANAGGVVRQLRADVLQVSAFDRLGAARAGLRDESQLFGLLVSYTDFGGCRHMVAAVGVQPPRFADADDLMRRACVRLEHADRLFTRAVGREAAHLLVHATREALKATPLLDRAALELERRA